MKQRALFPGFVLSLLLVIGLAAGAAAAEPKYLNVGWTSGSNWTALPFRIAAERGFFEKEGLRVRFIQFQGTNLMLTALLAGEVDYITILPFIAGAAVRGLPVKIIAAVTKSSGYAIVSKPEINSLKDLKGKRIAINSFGSSADFAVYTALSRSGLDPNRDVALAAVSGSPDARFREQFNPELTVPDSVVEEWIAVGTFRAKEKVAVRPQTVRDWTFAEKAK